MFFYERLNQFLNKHSAYQQFPLSKDDNKDKFLDIINPEWQNKIQKQYAEYENYVTYYIPFYKQSVLKELQSLCMEFPEINFEFQVRVKSRISAYEKVLRKLHEGKSGTVYDIFAHKIIINSVNGDSSEEKLIPICYDVAEFLSTFDSNSIELLNKRKDYIFIPKENNYQSIHLFKKHHLQHISFYSERQIKTASMRLNEVEGTASHANTYKNRFCILQTVSNIQDVVPNYLDVVYDRHHIPTRIVEKNFEESFQYFFHMSLTDYKNSVKDFTLSY